MGYCCKILQHQSIFTVQLDDMMIEYEHEYTPMLSTAYGFLSRKGKTVNGSAINQAKHDFIIASGGCCLHCGTSLTSSNSNTEHIHDRALGGHNKAGNKIIICIGCNLARNKTMQEYLGQPSYWRVFQEIGIGSRSTYYGMRLQQIRGIELEEYTPKYTPSLKILSAAKEGKYHLLSTGLEEMTISE